MKFYKLKDNNSVEIRGFGIGPVLNPGLGASRPALNLPDRDGRGGASPPGQPDRDPTAGGGRKQGNFKTQAPESSRIGTQFESF